MDINLEYPKIFKPIFSTYKPFILLDGGRSSAKSETVARFLLQESLLKKTNNLCSREFQNSIGDSVHALLVRLINEQFSPKLFDIKDNIIHSIIGSKFIFKGMARNIGSLRALDKIDNLWIEEGQYISKESIDITFPTLRSDGCKIITSMNRLQDMDPIYELLTKDFKNETLHIYSTYLDNPYCSSFTKMLAKKCKEERPNDYEHIWLGRPMVQGNDCILDRVKVREAMERKEANQDGPIQWGVDVARKGDDKTVITKRHGFKVLEQLVFSKLRTTEIVDKMLGLIKDKQTEVVNVDDTGVGGGVSDGLIKEKIITNELVFNSSKIKEINKYPNVASEMWFDFEELINTEEISIPKDEELYRELITRTWEMDNKGRRKVTSKKIQKKELKRSPDKADSLLLAFYNSNCYDKFEYSGGSKTTLKIDLDW